MLKNYKDNDKRTAQKIRSIILNKYKPVDDETEQINNQTDNRADFLGLRIIDNLIRFNQSFRLSQVAIKANMSRSDKKDDKKDDDDMKGGMVTRSKRGVHEEEKAEEKNLIQKTLENLTQKKQEKKPKKEEKATDIKKIAQGLLDNIIKDAAKKADAPEKLEKELNQLDGDGKFSQSFESLLSAYSLMENIRKNYRDLRPIFNELSVPIFNDLKDILDDSNDLMSKSIKTLYKGRSVHTQKSISANLDYYNDRLDQIIKIFDSIYDDFQQRKQTFNTNIRTGAGFSYLKQIRKI
jgi:hypothetical protein